jgi:hypothetical protein
MSVRRSMKRATAGMRTLYHFTPPANLPAILKNGIYPFPQKDNPQLPGSPYAIWLTSNPNGNLITDADLAYWRRMGQPGLIAEYETERRRFIFGCNDGGSARITVQIPRKFPGLLNYRQCITEIYRDSPRALAILTGIPDVPNWWVVVTPATAETFTGIGPAGITEIHPVGEPTAAYLEAVEDFESGRRRRDDRG